MFSLSALWNLNSFLVFCLLALCSCSPTEKESKTVESAIVVHEINADTIKILNEHKLELTRAYARHHYGLDQYTLDSIKMVVIHYTVIPTLEETVALFKRDSLTSNRKYIGNFSRLNVGIHYIVDTDGSIYSLIPDSVIARHIIGFNHVSIGIENIAASASHLTDEQLASNVQLVKFLSDRHHTINYLIGHDEYNDTTLAHYSLYRSLDANYTPYDKPDPGSQFMTRLRKALKEEHGLEFRK